MTRRSTSRLLAAGAIAAAMVLHLLLQASMMRGWAGWNLSAFRNYFASDQLAYLAIATDVAHGESAFVEPYTLTGSNYYPRGYYIVLGTLARLTSTHPATMWTVVGLTAQVMLVAMIGLTCVLLTRRWWSGLLGFAPFLVGTGSWIIRDTWMTTLDSHAVLWGPFGVFFTLNGESVSLCLGAAAALGLLLVGAGRVSRRWTWPVVLLASLVVGLLANIQTYSFLISVFLVAGGAAAVGLSRTRSWLPYGMTAIGVVVVFLLGPPLADAVSPLAVLVVGLLPALPGLVLLLREVGFRLLWCAVAVAVGASPQVLATVLGLAGGDEFLTYREASSKNLGVPLLHGVFAGMWIIPALAFVVWVGFRHRERMMRAVPPGLVATWAFLAANDHWGANQEPYRFWLDCYAVITILTVPLVAWAAVVALARRGAAPVPARSTEPGPVGGYPELAAVTTAGAEPPPAGRTRAVTAGALVLAVAFAAVSAVDWPLFRRGVTEWAYIALSTPRLEAAADLAAQTDGGIVLTDACVDPLTFKIAWGGPVAFFNRGLAWPDHVEAVDALVAARGEGLVDVEAAQRADVRWLLADPACAVDATAGLTLVETRDWSDAVSSGSLELWRIGG